MTVTVTITVWSTFGYNLFEPKDFQKIYATFLTYCFPFDRSENDQIMFRCGDARMYWRYNTLHKPDGYHYKPLIASQQLCPYP